ncbi:zinc metalloprotease [Aliidongia dinghuensis]|uniref:Zinc metalloprotease n=1 Tax=Aliidongia dinghuensis TaxID=1867774 RepID=A0A8J2YYD3_9PROT|nr:RIP metalloprotease RseP [Aliidongia dinghuensis]GGF40396.1 zinc metalloprotease [Aliidongia dinghuensis]
MSFLTGGLGTIVPFLVVLTILVFVHEMGHYLIARRNGVKVETFSIGFGPELFGWFDRSGTRWKLSAIPLGGYVKMYGDADAASAPSEALEHMNETERSVSFHHKRLGQRAAIIAAGPAANFLFTIVVYSILFMTIGRGVTPPTVGQVMPESAAAAAGIQAGDVITRIDGRTISSFEDIVQVVLLNTGTPINLAVDRNGTEQKFTVTPQMVDQKDHFGHHHRLGQLGIRATSQAVFTKLDPATAVWEAGRQTWLAVTTTLDGVGQMITGARTTDDLGGPIKIATMSGEVAKLGIVPLINFMALLSVNLGLINLFPIPVLDGGHLLFYAAEAVLGRPLGQRAQEYGFRIGLALVLTLMVFATWNDVVQRWGGS